MTRYNELSAAEREAIGTQMPGLIFFHTPPLNDAPLVTTLSNHQSTDMTKAEASDIQLRWLQQADPPLCEHLHVELEQAEVGDVSGTYRCTSCGQAVPG